MSLHFLTFTTATSSQESYGVRQEDGSVFSLSQARKLLTAQEQQTLPTSLIELIRQPEFDLDLIDRMRSDPALESCQISAEEVQYLPPVVPQKNIFCVGRNYREHIIEGNIANGRPANAFPEAIEIFTKPPTALVGHGGDVMRHRALTASLDYEAELAVMIGRRGRDIPESQALDHVFGYSIANDVTARNLQRRHGQWFKGKALDTSCPLGPVIVHKKHIPNPNDLRIELRVNGEVRQSASTNEMIFNVQSIIAHLSQGLTLEPGDVICTGTPKGVGFASNPPRCLETGDFIQVTIEGIGELRNRVVE